VSTDAAKMMLFEANKKSTGLAYALWFFLGGLQFWGWVLFAVGVGAFILAAVVVWWIVDAFLIAGFAKRSNMELAARLLKTV
jgi:hypothetical protein